MTSDTWKHRDTRERESHRDRLGETRAHLGRRVLTLPALPSLIPRIRALNRTRSSLLERPPASSFGPDGYIGGWHGMPHAVSRQCWVLTLGQRPAEAAETGG